MNILPTKNRKMTVLITIFMIIITVSLFKFALYT